MKVDDIGESSIIGVDILEAITKSKKPLVKEDFEKSLRETGQGIIENRVS